MVYSSRGLWAIVLVWLTAKLINKRTEESDPRKLIMRFTGALLMFIAIVLAVLTSH